MIQIPYFIGVNEKFVNLHTVALIEDESTEHQSIAKITTSDGTEIQLTGTDADLVFERVELFTVAIDEVISRLQQAHVQSD